MKVHQVLSGAGPYDAITREALAIRDLVGTWGWAGEIFAAQMDPRVGRRVHELSRLRPRPEDTLLIHYSAYAPRLKRVLDLPGRKVLLSHNVTPARWFWDHDAFAGIQCALGRTELEEFADSCDAVAGVSRFNAQELGSDRVVPLLTAGRRPDAEPAAPTGPPTVLFVGRLAPHKRQDELIRVIALLRRHRLPDARLVLVGEPLHERYLEALRELAAQLAPGAVTFESSLSDAELAARYDSAHVFCCLSEHEGFCIPILEAFAHGVPVVARPHGAVAETAGDAALLLDGTPDEMAELVHFAATDAELRAELRERGRARLADYAPERTAAALKALLSP